jgi:hypothetical protein
MLSLVYFILSSYGLTQIICYGKIFDNIRPSHYIFKCPMCMGFWIGVFLFCINASTELFNYEYSFINALVLGGLSSGTSYILCTLFGDDGINISKDLESEVNNNE